MLEWRLFGTAPKHAARPRESVIAHCLRVYLEISRRAALRRTEGSLSLPMTTLCAPRSGSAALGVVAVGRWSAVCPSVRPSQAAGRWRRPTDVLGTSALPRGSGAPPKQRSSCAPTCATCLSGHVRRTGSGHLAWRPSSIGGNCGGTTARAARTARACPLFIEEKRLLADGQRRGEGTPIEKTVRHARRHGARRAAIGGPSRPAATAAPRQAPPRSHSWTLAGGGTAVRPSRGVPAPAALFSQARCPVCVRVRCGRRPKAGPGRGAARPSGRRGEPAAGREGGRRRQRSPSAGAPPSHGVRA